MQIVGVSTYHLEEDEREATNERNDQAQIERLRIGSTWMRTATVISFLPLESFEYIIR